MSPTDINPIMSTRYRDTQSGTMKKNTHRWVTDRTQLCVCLYNHGIINTMKRTSKPLHKTPLMLLNRYWRWENILFDCTCDFYRIVLLDAMTDHYNHKFCYEYSNFHLDLLIAKQSSSARKWLLWYCLCCKNIYNHYTTYNIRSWWSNGCFYEHLIFKVNQYTLLSTRDTWLITNHQHGFFL